MALHFSHPLISADIPDSVCHTAENYLCKRGGICRSQEANLLQADLQTDSVWDCGYFRSPPKRDDSLIYAQLAFN